MFRVFFAAYLALFSCLLPALHTCDPIHGLPDREAAPRSTQASPDHQHHHHGDHSAQSHNDLCIICQLSESSGGVLPTLPQMLGVVPSISAHGDPQLPARPPRFTPEEKLPRAPPA